MKLPRSTNIPMLMFSFPYVRRDLFGVTCKNRLSRRCTVTRIRRIEPATIYAMYRSVYPNLPAANSAITNRRNNAPLLMFTAVTSLNRFTAWAVKIKKVRTFTTIALTSTARPILRKGRPITISTSASTPTTRNCSMRRNLNARWISCSISPNSFPAQRTSMPSMNPK